MLLQDNRCQNKKHKKLFITFLLYMGICIATYAQGTTFPNNYIINVQQFGIEDGLLHQNIRCVTQDTNGFIWIGIPKGVARYDGYNFKCLWEGKRKIK